jgi:hypothetical protein
MDDIDKIFSKFRPLNHNAGNTIYGLGGDLKSKKFQDNYRFGNILKNSELYAPTFEKFNDIDEGRFCIYGDYRQNQNLINIIRNQKGKLHICSFSHTYDTNFIEDKMWAHYANAHCGVKIDFKIDQEKFKDKLLKVEYNDQEINISTTPSPEEIEKIISKKKSCWVEEAEYRAITSKGFVPIKITKITLGKKFSSKNYTNKGVENDDFENNIKGVVKQILDVLKNSGNYSSSLPEIWAYKTMYSQDPQKINLEE